MLILHAFRRALGQVLQLEKAVSFNCTEPFREPQGTLRKDWMKVANCWAFEVEGSLRSCRGVAAAQSTGYTCRSSIQLITKQGTLRVHDFQLGSVFVRASPSISARPISLQEQAIAKALPSIHWKLSSLWPGAQRAWSKQWAPQPIPGTETAVWTRVTLGVEGRMRKCLR